MSFSYMHADRRTYIYPPLDKRYSRIISTICGPNKYKEEMTMKNALEELIAWDDLYNPELSNKLNIK